MKRGWYEYWQEIKDEIWKEAMEDARDELGYSENQWVPDWDELLDAAKDYFKSHREREYDDYDDQGIKNA